MFKSPGWAAVIDLNIANGVAGAVSRPRLVPYGIEQATKSPIAVVAEHGRNVTLCEALYPTLHMLEVVMRNSIHRGFSNFFGGVDWFDDPTLTQSHSDMVAEAKAELTRRGKPLEPDRIVAQLSFGFWCGMFSHFYEGKLLPWPSQIPSILPRVPKSWRTRDKVQSRVEEARKIRNRVFHHESVMRISNLPMAHRSLVELLGWFSPEARIHLESMCRFQPTYQDKLVEGEVTVVEN